MTGNIIATMPAVQALATTYGLEAEHFIHTMKKIAMPAGISDAEFVSCCLVAREHVLNPLTKEIYFMKTKAGSIQPIVSVDGWIKKCNAHPQFDGMDFEDHVGAENKIDAITCSIYRKDRSRPTRAKEYMAECKGSGGPWASHPLRMLRHRALMQAARMAFGFAGVMDPDEFEAWQMRDVTPAPTRIEPPVPDTEPEAITDVLIEMTPAEAEHILFEIRNDVEGVTEPEIMAEHAENYAAVIATMPESYAAKARELLAPPSPPRAAEVQAPPPADHERPVAAAGADIRAKAERIIANMERAPNRTTLGAIERQVAQGDWPDDVKKTLRAASQAARARLMPVTNGVGA